MDSVCLNCEYHFDGGICAGSNEFYGKRTEDDFTCKYYRLSFELFCKITPLEDVL